MITVDVDAFKSIAKKFTEEFNTKYCPEQKIKLSAGQEALSHAFGYRDFNTIRPVLASVPYGKKQELLDAGYFDIRKIKISFAKISERAQENLIESVFLTTLFMYRTAISLEEENFFLSFSKNNFPTKTIMDEVKMAAICAGAKINIMEDNNDEILCYWTSGEKDYILPPIIKTIKPSTCMHLYSSKEKNRECVINKILGKKSLSIRLFSSVDGYLSDEESMINIDRLFVTYDDDYQMRSVSKLINDVVNRELNYMIFKDTFFGLLRARYIVQNHPDIALFVLTKIYGYNPDFI